MARRSASKATPDKRKRTRIPRQKKEQSSTDLGDRTWLIRIAVMMDAKKVLNHHKERPYWLSIPHGENDGNPPVVDFYPLAMFRTKDRTYYGFLFRDHRDYAVTQLIDARKEYTEDALARAGALIL